MVSMVLRWTLPRSRRGPSNGSDAPMNLVLASGSPRRSRLLRDSGFDLVVREPDVEETHHGHPPEFVVMNARSKALSVRAEGGDIVIGADTVVICGGEVLGKPKDREDARRMVELQLLHPQEVITGICIIDTSGGKEYTGYEVSTVVMDGGEDAVEKHINSGQWEGKAGAYGIQDRGPLKARVLAGSEDNVVGLPMALVRRLLSLVGFEYPKRTPSEG
ncbi:MAG: Maf family protein [Thermoplasmatota archaeon]